MTPTVSSFLARHRRIGFDSNIVISFVEENPDFVEQIQNILDQMRKGQHQIWLSTIGVTEVLSKPTRENQVDLLGQYRELLFTGQFSFAEISLDASHHAARLNLKVRDALHVASLMEVGVTGFITADRGVKSIKGLEVLSLKA